MGDVRVAFSANNAETATLLLAAAEDLELGSAVVRTEESNFVVPEEVADKAFGKGKTEAKNTAEVQKEADEAAAEAQGRVAPSAEEDRDGYDEKPAAKKAAAKKAAAKKSAAK
jgi:hypothetical protein